MHDARHSKHSSLWQLSLLPIMGSILLIGGALCCCNMYVGKEYCGKSGPQQWHQNVRLKRKKTLRGEMFHSRQDGQGRHLLPQAASSPPQGPNTLHIYIGARHPANTIQLLSFFLFRRCFSWNKSLLLISSRNQKWKLVEERSASSSGSSAGPDT